MKVFRNQQRKYSGLVQKMSNGRLIAALFVLIGGLVVVGETVWADGWNAINAPNRIISEPQSGSLQQLGGITNTRHNLTQAFIPDVKRAFMDPLRNNYFEVCVYCHTPHAANSTAAAPLWNRTVTQRTYTMYSTKAEPTALGQAQSQPGPNSLTCLSCHDGATAIDSIINMPTQLTAANYRAGYNAAQQTGVDPSFLNQWQGARVGSAGAAHAGFNTTETSMCFTCHNNSSSNGVGLNGAPDFRLFSIGDEFGDTVAVPGAGDLPVKKSNFLADDHPIGVKYPTDFRPGVDYNEPRMKDRIAFFDLNGDGHADPNEIRLYDSGDGYEVECGSCHDPHGVVASGVENSELVPSFLRVGEYSQAASTTSSQTLSGNAGSKLCLTCHVK